jgi:hypothetical protein
MATKKENVLDDFQEDDKISKEYEAKIRAKILKEIEEEQRRKQLEEEEENKKKKLWGYNITLSHANYFALHKKAEFWINGEVWVVPEGVPTDVPEAVVWIIEDHCEKNKNNPTSIMYRCVKNKPIYK